jgi:hypothetical protein
MSRNSFARAQQELEEEEFEYEQEEGYGYQAEQQVQCVTCNARPHYDGELPLISNYFCGYCCSKNSGAMTFKQSLKAFVVHIINDHANENDLVACGELLLGMYPPERVKSKSDVVGGKQTTTRLTSVALGSNRSGSVSASGSVARSVSGSVTGSVVRSVVRSVQRAPGSNMSVASRATTRPSSVHGTMLPAQSRGSRHYPLPPHTSGGIDEVSAPPQPPRFNRAGNQEALELLMMQPGFADMLQAAALKQRKDDILY